MKINKKALELIEKGLSSNTVSKLTESQIQTLHSKLFISEQLLEINTNISKTLRGINTNSNCSGRCNCNRQNDEFRQENDMTELFTLKQKIETMKKEIKSLTQSHAKTIEKLEERIKPSNSENKGFKFSLSESKNNSKNNNIRYDKPAEFNKMKGYNFIDNKIEEPSEIYSFKKKEQEKAEEDEIGLMNAFDKINYEFADNANEVISDYTPVIQEENKKEESNDDITVQQYD